MNKTNHQCHVKHGMSKKSEYRIWLNMKYRCNNPNASNYFGYGGRGIKVCPRWMESFENFWEDMGERPTKKHSIHRINNDGNYEPSNCKWATKKEQARDKRDSRMIPYKGQIKCLAQWADEFNLPYSVVITRIDHMGWDIHRALTEPVNIAKVFILGDNSYTVEELAQKYKISDSLIYTRLKNGENIEEAVRPSRKSRNHTYNNKSLTVKEWAKESGINHNLLKYRLKMGYSLEKALTTPVKIYNRDHNGK